MLYVLNLNLFVDEYENRKHLYFKEAIRSCFNQTREVISI